MRRFEPSSIRQRSDPIWSKAEIDHPRIDKEMNRPGMTMLTLWREYCEDALASGMEPYLYSAFCQKHRAWRPPTRSPCASSANPPRRCRVDYGRRHHGGARRRHRRGAQSLRLRGVLALFGRDVRRGRLQHESGVLGRGPRPRLRLLRRQRADSGSRQPQAGRRQEHRRRARDQRAVPQDGPSTTGAPSCPRAPGGRGTRGRWR